ncbi:RDD family protein [Anaerococcus lactolyticus ATCC 51172]|uniref:RDD family protein n=1 Tax=Anaerococcus lactolyticus ATCC 51172 TaxID=525254 RepID=C2BFK3_9FIRM|nr:RDD family protein [Anaerococcus lactolyticus]EEI86290.1 RDD family protein [Anaerococcus lactolyticus ATCC 51172]
MEDKKVFEERDFAYAYSSFGLRFLAYLIDMMVISAIFSIGKFIFPIDPEAKVLGLVLADVIYTIVSLAYFTILSLITRGQSLGKIITGLRVVSVGGGNLSTSQILIREIAGRYIQNKFIFLYALALVTPKKQSFIDLFTDTSVVKEDAFKALYTEEI